MATNEEKRRAIGSNNEAARRAIGTNNEAARRRIGSDMIERRTGRAQVDDINALVNQPRQRRTLPAVAPRGGVPAQTGTGNYTAPPAGAGGGIAGPLVEVSGSREYFANKTQFYTSDFLFVVEIQPLRRMTMMDANGAEVPFEYREPPTDV